VVFVKFVMILLFFFHLMCSFDIHNSHRDKIMVVVVLVPVLFFWYQQRKKYVKGVHKKVPPNSKSTASFFLLYFNQHFFLFFFYIYKIYNLSSSFFDVLCSPIINFYMMIFSTTLYLFQLLFVFFFPLPRLLPFIL
jgi:hypothetical protein